MIKKRVVLLSAFVLLCIFGLAGCGEKTSGLDFDYYVEGNQEVLVVIEYEANALFAKDAMDIYIDNHKFYTVNNGDSNVNVYNLTKGTHVLKVASNTYHYDSEEFEVKNTGDYFTFTIKNKTNEVELSMKESGNQYAVLGSEIPETLDDSDLSMTQSQIEAAKSNRTIWSYIWIVIKACLIFMAFAIVLLAGGVALYSIFKMLNMRKIGLIIEFIGICILSVYKGATVMTFVFPVVFIIMCRVVSVRMKNVPKEYRNFYAVKDDETSSYQMIHSIIFAVLLAVMPEILDILPFQVLYVEYYMIAYIVLALFYLIGVLKSSLEYPERVKQFVYEKGIVSEEEMFEFVIKNGGEDLSDDEIKSRTDRMLRTLADLAKIDLIVKDDDGKCFRRKE